MTTMRTTSTWLMLLVLLVMSTPSAARAESGVQVTRDGRRNLISKDVGNERWAITYDLDDKTATGNVFRSDGSAPAFVSCETLSETRSELTLRCYGADRCQSSPCSTNDWTFISDATLPLQFFHPPGAVATPGPVATATPKPAPTTTPAPSDSLQALIGTWSFTFTIISTFTDTYRLQAIDTSTGTRLLRGEDQFGDLVVAARGDELVPGSSSPYEFALLDPSLYTCDFHVFDRTGATSVGGLTYVMLTDSAGHCDSSTLSNPFAMHGTRLSTAAAIPAVSASAADMGEARAARGTALSVEVNAVATREMVTDPGIADLVRTLDAHRP